MATSDIVSDGKRLVHCSFHIFERGELQWKAKDKIQNIIDTKFDGQLCWINSDSSPISLIRALATRSYKVELLENF